MSDWRSEISRNTDRISQLSGNDATRGIFQATIDSAEGESQSGKFIYAGGERNIPLPMPFESSNAWIRAIPDSSTLALAGYRSDNQDPVCLGYMIENPKDKLSAYESVLNRYRPLQPGEIEINSVGGAQSYYTARPVLEQRAGPVKSWLDQDRLESGTKAPTHVRFLHDHKSNKTGDQENFGVVKRPYNFLYDPILFTPRNVLTAVLALSDKSFNYYDYPVPGATTPLGVADIFSPKVNETASRASAAVLLAAGQFKQRVFAKEYLKVISNPLFPASPNPILLDIREGQVFDDDGLQVTASTGAFLRAKYEYFTPALDSTKIEIDEVGNMNTSFSIGASQGWNISIPTGPYTLVALQDISMASRAGHIDMKSTLSTDITAYTDITLTSIVNTSFSTLVDFSHTIGGEHSVSTALNSKSEAVLNMDLNAGINFTAKATTGKMVLQAPLVDIGITPSQSMILGDLLATWLDTLITALQAAAPIGNFGAPVPLMSDPAFAAQLTVLKSLITPLKSVTIKVSP